MGWCVCEQEGDSESSAVHATFAAAVEDMSAVSEDYQRQAVAFLRGLLQPDPAKRLTAKDAVHHPFLAGTFPEVAPDLSPPEPEEEEERVPQDTRERMILEAIDDQNGAT
jgi:hypothetical protein